MVARKRTWEKSEAGKKYRSTLAGKEKRKAWMNSEKGKLSARRTEDRERFGGNRIKTLERDSYKCRLCGSVDRLHVHHVDGKGTGYLANERDDRLDNLITLCKACHRRQHNIGERNPVWKGGITRNIKDYMRNYMKQYREKLCSKVLGF